MTEPIQLRAHRVVRITDADVANPMHLERLLQPLYMTAEPVVDLTAFDGPVQKLASQLNHLNRYHTSKGGERLRIVTGSVNVRRALNDGGTSVFSFYDTLNDALTTPADTITDDRTSQQK